MKSKLDIGESLIKMLLLKRGMGEFLAYRISELSVKDRRNIVVGSSPYYEMLLVPQVHAMLLNSLQLSDEERKDEKLISLISSLLGSKKEGYSFSFLVMCFLSFFRYYEAVFNNTLLMNSYDEKVEEVREGCIDNLRGVMVRYLSAQIMNSSYKSNNERYKDNFTFYLNDDTMHGYLDSLGREEYKYLCKLREVIERAIRREKERE